MSKYIKELAPRLPYGVKIYHEEYGEASFMELIGVEIGGLILHDHNGLQRASDSSSWAKPVLRPMSDLNKEIAHKGETFVPSVRLGYFIEADIEFAQSAPDALTYREVQKLLEWHFDINGCIQKGLAIDVNTLKENCYE